MQYLLIATIDGSRQEQGYYTQLEHAFSRIRQVNEQYEFLEIGEPTAYELILVKKGVI